jgi:hypothetical protein
MKKPNMFLDIEKEIEKFIAKKIHNHRINIIAYIANKKGLNDKTFDVNKLSVSYEYSNNTTETEPRTTLRYDGELWLQMVFIGKDRINVKFESPFIK